MHYSDLFPDFPDTSRVWIYAADQPLSDDQQQHLLQRLDQFFDGWTSHRRGVKGAATILADRFVMLAAYIPDGDISGCGIDKSVRIIDKAGRELDIEWLSPLHVFFRDDAGRVQHLPRAGFRKQVRAGAVTAETSVFDVSVSTLDAVRRGAFEQPAGASWHAKVFRIPQPTT